MEIWVLAHQAYEETILPVMTMTSRKENGVCVTNCTHCGCRFEARTRVLLWDALSHHVDNSSGCRDKEIKAFERHREAEEAIFQAMVQGKIRIFA